MLGLVSLRVTQSLTVGLKRDTNGQQSSIIVTELVTMIGVFEHRVQRCHCVTDYHSITSWKGLSQPDFYSKRATTRKALARSFKVCIGALHSTAPDRAGPESTRLRAARQRGARAGRLPRTDLRQDVFLR